MPLKLNLVIVIFLLIKIILFLAPPKMIHPVRPNPKQNTVTNRGDAGKIEELSNQILELKVLLSI